MKGESINNVLTPFLQIAQKPLFWFILAVYLLSIVVFIYKPLIQKSIDSELRFASARITDLEFSLEKSEQLISLCKKNYKSYGFLNLIEFRETNLIDQERKKLLRLFEFAEFAIEKEDFVYAEKLYLEANNTYNSAYGYYLIGRLYYISGALDKAESAWQNAIEIDSELFYPEIRFYFFNPFIRKRR